MRAEARPQAPSIQAQAPTQPPASIGPVTARPANSHSAELTWTEPDGAATVRIRRDGRLLDEFPTGSTTYTDHLLWPATSYRYEVGFRSSSAEFLAAIKATLTTPPQAGAFPRLYAPWSFINERVPSAARADPDSKLMVERALVAHADRANLAKSDRWGGALAYANPQTRRYSVACLRYGCDVDPPPFPIPSYARPELGSDAHLTVLDPQSGNELDMWEAERRQDGSWAAGTRVVMPFVDGWGAACEPGSRCLSAVASGFAFPAGMIRPEEIAQGHIDHALVLMAPLVRKDFAACPATWTGGRSTDPGSLPEGARIQLDPGYDIAASGLPRWKRVIMRALKQYGAYVGDTGGSLAIRAESNLLRGYDAWARAGIAGEYAMLDDLPWGRMRVLELERCF